MSNREKAIQLLEQIPENELHYIIHILENAIPQNNTSKSMDGLRTLQSFAGTLPEDFNYAQELEEARREKYGRFN